MSPRKLRVLSGFNEGAEFQIESGIPVILGNHPDCSLVLIDQNIVDRHCQFILTVAGLMCTALNGKLAVGDKELSPGETAKVDNLQCVKCGDVSIATAENDVNWDDVQRNSAARPRNKINKIPDRKRNLFIGVAVAAVILFATIGLVTFNSSSKITQSYVSEARAWLKTIAPAGSELEINEGKDNQLVLSGYVPTNYQNELLMMTVHNSVFHPKIEVYSVEQMLASMSRLANLEGISCVVAYRNEGRIACTNKIDNVNSEQRLQVLAQQISGVKSLEVSAYATEPAEEIVTVEKEHPASPQAEPKAGATNTVTQFARKLFIMMSKRGRYVIDSNGYKFSEGDVIDGYTLTSIELDQIKLEKNGERYLIAVGAMR
jgi:hypothetical protein